MIKIFHYNLQNTAFLLLIFRVIQAITLFFPAFLRV